MDKNQKKTKKQKPMAIVVSQQTTPEALIMQGINKGISVDTMERLMVIRREVKEEHAKEAFNLAMSQFQTECPIIKKNKKVLNKPEKGGGVRYAYAPLDSIVEQVRSLLQKYHFSYTIDAEVDEKWVKATCKVTHELGHSETSTFKVPVDAEAYMTQPQKFASALTFAKRYAFCNALGILTGDDDDDSQNTEEKGKKNVKDTFLSAEKMIKTQTNRQVLAQWRHKISGSKAYTKEQREKLIQQIDEQVKKS